MADDLANLRSQESDIRYRISITKSEIATIKTKITRLEKVYEKIASIKDSIEAEKKKAKYKTFLSGDKDNWKGEKSESFEEAIDDGVKNEYRQYYGAVDTLHDNLVDKITFYRDQRDYKENVVLGALTSSLRVISAEIQKIFN